MDQISAQPLYHFLASVLAVAPALTFAAMFISSLPSILARRAARKVAPVTATTRNRRTN